MTIAVSVAMVGFALSVAGFVYVGKAVDRGQWSTAVAGFVTFAYLAWQSVWVSVELVWSD